MADIGAHGASDDVKSPQRTMHYGPVVFQGHTLSNAAAQGRLGAALMCWKMGENVNREDASGVTPLHHACYNGHLPLVRFLVDKGANMDALTRTPPEDPQLHTPAIWAVCAGHTSIVHFLAAQGADMRWTDSQGYNAIFHAVHYDRCDIVVWLVEELGLDPLAIDKKGHNTAQWAAYKGYLGLLRLLHERYQVPLEQTDLESRTSLHWAAKLGRTEVVEYLLEQGCKQDARDKDRMTPYDLAVQDRRPESVQLLGAWEHQPIKKRMYASIVLGYGGRVTLDEKAARSILRKLFIPHYLRQAVLSLLCTLTVVLWLSKRVHVVMLYFLFPLVIVLPTWLNDVVLGPRHIKVRKSETPLRGTAAELLDPHDYNLSMLVNVLLLQLWLPYHLFGDSGVGAYIVANYPMLYSLGQGTVGLTWFMWCCCRLKGPRIVAGTLSPLKKPSGKVTPIARGEIEYRALQPKALRSEYCPFRKQVLAGYEFYTPFLDISVGDGNRAFYFGWYLSLALMCFMSAAFTFLWVQGGADGGAVLGNVSACRWTWGLFYNVFPAVPVDQRAPVEVPWNLLRGPTPQQYTSFWCLFVPSILLLAIIGHCGRLTGTWVYGFTTPELAKFREGNPPYIPTVDKQLSPVVVNGRHVFSRGSSMANLLGAFGISGGTPQSWVLSK